MPNHSIFEKPRAIILILTTFVIFLTACSDSEDKQTTHEATDAVTSIQSEQATLESVNELSPITALFIKLVNEHFSELIEKSKLLNESLIHFTKKPSKEGLHTSIEALEKTHALFVSGYFLDTCCLLYTPNQADDENNLNLLSIKTRLDQQPLLPGYLDVVDGYPFSGLIYSDIPITREKMEQEFQLGDPAYVTLGFHALELILKGSNLNRKVSDFAKLTNSEDTSSEPAELRRSLYAILLSSEIENDISKLKSNWDKNLKIQISQQSAEQAQGFFLELALNIEKEFQAIQLQQPEIDNRKQSDDEHINSVILTYKKALLEKFSELNKVKAAT